jgi:hypothetical protein
VPQLLNKVRSDERLFVLGSNHLHMIGDHGLMEMDEKMGSTQLRPSSSFFIIKATWLPVLLKKLESQLTRGLSLITIPIKKVPWVHGKSKTKKIMQLHHQTAPLSPFKASSIVIFLVSVSTQLFRVHKWRR